MLGENPYADHWRDVLASRIIRKCFRAKILQINCWLFAISGKDGMGRGRQSSGIMRVFTRRYGFSNMTDVIFLTPFST